MLDFGNVRLVGMTKQELQDSFKLRFDDARKALYMLPEDIYENTLRAYSVRCDDGFDLRRRGTDGPLHRAGQRAGVHRGSAQLR